MERRQDSLVPSVLSAGTDPAHIPGLDGPTADEPEQQPDAAEDAVPAAEETAEAPVPGTQARDEPAAEEAGPDETDTNETGTEEPAAEDAAAEGLSFEATDRRGAILADASGITFRLDDTEALIGWDEIGAVELGTGKFGRRFSVAVHTTKHRTFDGDVEAPSRKEVRTWTEEFDAVLDTWFDDGAKDEPEDAAPAEEETTEDVAEASTEGAAQEKDSEKETEKAAD